MIQEKALYNGLRISWLANPNIPVEKWQVEDYRALPTSTLLSQLKKLSISLDETSFLNYADTCATPEDLTDLLWMEEEDIKKRDQAYLLLFELWRRLLPHKTTLSLFCDELDARITLYDQKNEEEPLLAALVELEDILDDHVDQGMDPKQAFQTVCGMCAYDLEQFLYDFTSYQIDSQKELFASELIEGFYLYLRDPKWFDLLRVRLFAVTDEAEANIVLQRLLEQVQEEPSLDLLMEIGMSLMSIVEEEVFFNIIKQASVLLQTEEDLKQLLELVADYHQRLDQEAKEAAIRTLIAKRSTHDPKRTLQRPDPIFKLIESF